MKTKNTSIMEFLTNVMKRRQLAPAHLADALNISHATMSRWLSGQDKPNILSCRKLAEFSGMRINKILVFADHVPDANSSIPEEWPEFREYAQIKYGEELDDDLIVMIEDLIERKRDKRFIRGGSRQAPRRDIIRNRR